MRPGSASIRFHTREEDICNSKPIDWGAPYNSGGKASHNDASEVVAVGSASRHARLIRPLSAPPTSQIPTNCYNLSVWEHSAAANSLRPSATRPPSPAPDVTKTNSNTKTSLEDPNIPLLDDLTRGYKGLVTRDQLARCPTPRLDLFPPPPLDVRCDAGDALRSTGEVGGGRGGHV